MDCICERYAVNACNGISNACAKIDRRAFDCHWLGYRTYDSGRQRFEIDLPPKLRQHDKLVTP